MIDKKAKILRLLKKKGRIPTSRIAIKIKSSQWLAEQYLEQLETQGKIKRESETNATYWSLK